VKGSNTFDVVLSGMREHTGLRVGPGQWAIPDRVPVTVRRGDGVHDVGAGRISTDRKGNPKVHGLWSSTPLGEYVKALVANGAIRFADLELEATIDNAGARIYNVLSVVFTLPSDPPPLAPDHQSSAATGVGTVAVDSAAAAELLGLAARIYAADPRSDVTGLADRVIACAIALGGRPQP
jgi:hypothetical protein